MPIVYGPNTILNVLPVFVFLIHYHKIPMNFAVHICIFRYSHFMEGRKKGGREREKEKGGEGERERKEEKEGKPR